MRTALITGASRGIGRAIASAYQAKGWRTLCPARAELDLASAPAVGRFLKRNKKVTIDALVNCAGENKIASFEKIPFEDWSRILQTNLGSVFQLIGALAPAMAARGWGRIVNISSVYSGLARPGRAAYSASKAGLDALTRSAAVEFGAEGVLVNSVCPGFVETDMTRRNNDPKQIRELVALTAVGRLAQPAEIAAFVYFVGSEENTYLTGQCVRVDGGFTIQ